MKTTVLIFGIAATAAVFTGCATAPVRIQAGGPTAITSMGVDLMDFKNAAGEIVNGLLLHPTITSFPAQNGNRLPVINVGSIVNKSGIQIDMAQIAGRINEDLLNSGRCEIVANDAGAVGANVEDSAMNDTNVNAAGRADFFLEGTIGKLAASSGRTRENTYTFQIRLNNRTRRTVFQRTVDIAKQGSRGGSIGW